MFKRSAKGALLGVGAIAAGVVALSGFSIEHASPAHACRQVYYEPQQIIACDDVTDIGKPNYGYVGPKIDFDNNLPYQQWNQYPGRYPYQQFPQRGVTCNYNRMC